MPVFYVVHFVFKTFRIIPFADITVDFADVLCAVILTQSARQRCRSMSQRVCSPRCLYRDALTYDSFLWSL